jgi:hypothetical protein
LNNTHTSFVIISAGGRRRRRRRRRVLLQTTNNRLPPFFFFPSYPAAVSKMSLALSSRFVSEPPLEQSRRHHFVLVSKERNNKNRGKQKLKTKETNKPTKKERR